MRRRDFIQAIAGCAIASPRWAFAQQWAGPVIGFLGAETAELFASRLRQSAGLLKRAMSRAEISQSNIAGRRATTIDCRRLRTIWFVAKVRVIVTGGTPAALAAKAATATIAIVASLAVDPTRGRTRRSLARPAAMRRGHHAGAGVGPKQLEISERAACRRRRVVLLVQTDQPRHGRHRGHKLSTAAGMLGLQLRVMEASSEPDFERTFANLRSVGADALIVGNDLFFNSRLAQLADLALRHAVPGDAPVS